MDSERVTKYESSIVSGGQDFMVDVKRAYRGGGDSEGL